MSETNLDKIYFVDKEGARRLVDNSIVYVDRQIEGHNHSFEELEDKPFGTRIGRKILIDKTFSVYYWGMLNTIQDFPNTVILEEGKTYAMYINGFRYEYVAQKDGDLVYIGNDNVADQYDAYFSYNPYTNPANTLICFPETNTYHLQIDDLNHEYVHALDEKFIPSTISRTLDVDTQFEQIEKDIDAVVEELDENISKLQPQIDGKAELDHNHSFEVLEDKPFGEETSLVEYLPEQNIYFAIEIDGVSFHRGTIMPYDFNAKLKSGSAYNIYIDGIKYTSIAKENDVVSNSGVASTNIYLGNLSFSKRGDNDYEDTGEAFYIACNKQNDSGLEICWLKSFGESPTVHIVEIQESVKTLDEKYIPDTIARTVDVDAEFEEFDNELQQHMGNTSAHLTDNEKSKIEEAYTHITEGHAPIDAEKNVIVGITRNGEAITVSENRIVDIVVPTTAEEIGADPVNSAANALASANANITAAESRLQELIDKKVPDTRKVNGKALTEDITLSYTDVGADQSGAASAVQGNLESHIENDLHIKSDERAKLDGIESGAQVNTIIGVKGDAESTYRTGEVNITAANIGLGNVNNTSDANKPVSSAQKTAIDKAEENANLYTDEAVKNLASTTVVDNKISTHNTSTSAHGDIRELIADLTTRLNTVANSDDVTLDQLSEIVAYIKNNNTLIEGITNSKISTEDIVTNLTTNSNTKVAAASTVVTLKGLIDALDTELDNQVASLNSAISGKAPNSHTHAIADVTNLQTTLDGKANNGHNHAASNITSGTLSSDRLPVVPASKGGTGQTTLLSSAYALIDSLSEGSSAPADDVYYITQYAGTDSSNSGSYYKRRHSSLWDYIREKINLVLGLTPTQYNGKAATAGTADLANTATTLTGLTATVAELNKMDGVTVGYTDINKLSGLKDNIQTQLDSKSNNGHTHNYAGSSSAGGAATKLALEQGTADTPRYIPFQHGDGSSSELTACYDADFQYNPYTNELFAQNLKATTATFSDSATIQYNSDTESIDFTFA